MMRRDGRAVNLGIAYHGTVTGRWSAAEMKAFDMLPLVEKLTPILEERFDAVVTNLVHDSIEINADPQYHSEIRQLVKDIQTSDQERKIQCLVVNHIS